MHAYDSHLKIRTLYFPLNLFLHLGSQPCARDLSDDSFFSFNRLRENDGISVAGSVAIRE